MRPILAVPVMKFWGRSLRRAKNRRIKSGSKLFLFLIPTVASGEFCLQGKTNICKDKKSFGVTVNGLFAQEIIIDSEFVVPVPPDLADERAVIGMSEERARREILDRLEPGGGRVLEVSIGPMGQLAISGQTPRCGRKCSGWISR